MLLFIAVLYGLAGSVLIRGIYSILRLRRGSFELPIDYKSFTSPLVYLSLQEFLSLRNRSWARFFLFRSVPQFISMIAMVGFMQENNHASNLSLAIAFLVSILFSYLPGWGKIRFKDQYTSVKLLYCLEILLSVIIGVVFFILSINGVPFSALIPSFYSLRDGLWSALFAGILVASYINLTDMRCPNNPSTAMQTESLIDQRNIRIEKKYGTSIDKASMTYEIDRGLIKSILIYEDLNRPAFIRMLERIAVKFLHVSLTVGIAQVFSNDCISDEESIQRMSAQLKEWKNEFKLSKSGIDDETDYLLHRYNDNAQYAENVQKIYHHLRSNY